MLALGQKLKDNLKQATDLYSNFMFIFIYIKIQTAHTHTPCKTLL